MGDLLFSEGKLRSRDLRVREGGEKLEERGRGGCGQGVLYKRRIKEKKQI